MPTPNIWITGNVVKDPYQGTDKNGKPFLSIRVACSDSHKDEQGNWVTDRELFLNVTEFNCSTNIRIPAKGDGITAAGRIYEREYEKDGETRRGLQMDAVHIRTWSRNNNSGSGWGATPPVQPNTGHPTNTPANTGPAPVHNPVGQQAQANNQPQLNTNGGGDPWGGADSFGSQDNPPF